ncbi:MAG: hypothetical protein LBT47_00120 [Deltaproteobacteria bacterium]|nr:hypothetical protein [Deltaproteobacteria bacterium]
MNLSMAKVLICSLLAGFLGSGLFYVVTGTTDARAQDPGLVTAGEFRLTDPSGRTRLLMTLVRDKPRLFMLDGEGEYRLEMGLGDTGEPHIWLRDSEGHSKIQVALTGKGLPSFTLADQQGRDRAVVALSQSGEPTLVLRDSKGKDRVAMWRDAKSEGIALADEKGQAQVALSVADGQNPSLTFFKDGTSYQSLP